MDTSDIILRAEGFAMLEMYLDAWETIETLPAEPRLRLHHAVITVRLWVCAGLFNWETGKELCRFAQGMPFLKLQEAMGKFYLAHAESLCVAGDIEAAKGYVKEMARVWPPGCEVALQSKLLGPDMANALRPFIFAPNGRHIYSPISQNTPVVSFSFSPGADDHAAFHPQK
jgi:hypothetical protein